MGPAQQAPAFAAFKALKAQRQDAATTYKRRSSSGSQPADAGAAGDRREVQDHAIALYDFQGECEGDLSFRAGDALVLLGTHLAWYRGHHVGCCADDAGVFPSNYVRRLQPGRYAGQSTIRHDRCHRQATVAHCFRYYWVKIGRWVRPVAGVLLAACLSVLCGWLWMIASLPIAQLPVWAFYLRYPLIGAAAERPPAVVMDWPRASLSRQELLRAMRHSMPVLVRGGYMANQSEDLRWAHSDEELLRLLGGAEVSLPCSHRCGNIVFAEAVSVAMCL
jgi:hypothetical protein